MASMWLVRVWMIGVMVVSKLVTRLGTMSGKTVKVIVGVFFFQAEDGIRDLVRLRWLGGLYKRQVLSFARGIGANTTLYTWAKALLFNPFPTVSEPAQLVAMHVTDKNQGVISVSYPDYRDIKARAKTVDGLIAMRPTAVGLGAGEKPSRVFAEIVSGNYFDVLRLSLIHISEPTRPY